MEIVSVAAVAENGVIGDEGELPWESIPADKAQYRALIADSPVISRISHSVVSPFFSEFLHWSGRGSTGFTRSSPKPYFE